MQTYGGQQSAADDPQQDVVGMQEVRVVVDLLVVGRINLQIADKVAEDVSEQDDAGDGHHHFLAEGGFVEPDGTIQLTGCRDGTHGGFLWWRRTNISV